MQIVNEIDCKKFHENHTKMIKKLDNLITTLKTTNRILLQTNGYDPDE